MIYTEASVEALVEAAKVRCGIALDGSSGLYEALCDLKPAPYPANPDWQQCDEFDRLRESNAELCRCLRDAVGYVPKTMNILKSDCLAALERAERGTT